MPARGSGKIRRLISRMRRNRVWRATMMPASLEQWTWKFGVHLISPETSQGISRKIFLKICPKIFLAAQGSSFYLNNRSRTTRTL